MAQIFANLLNNAAKYTNRGGRVILEVQRQGERVATSIKDNGIGIPAPMLPKLFEMFTQVDRSLEKAQGGLGIGLTIVKRLVEMHNGTVEVRSDGPGQGSEFVVYLPVLPGAPVTSQTPSAGTSAPATRGRRILVVDDNKDSARSLAALLAFVGHETRTAYDGLEALETAANFQPDLVLLDIGMPKLNGYDTCRRIREQPWGKGVVVIALTGWGQEEDQRRSQEAGFDQHLVKPVKLSMLEQVLAGLHATKA